MRAALSRSILTLATLCMRSRDHGWGSAMRSELEEVIAEGAGLQFAFGCLVASWGRMPAHDEGRFSLTIHALALGLIVPLGTLQVAGLWQGFPAMLSIGDFAVPNSLQGYLMTSAYQGLTPLIVGVSLLLGGAHLRLAWTLLDRDWARVEAAGAMSLAASVTIIIMIGLLDCNVGQALRQGAILLLERAIVATLARWHAELPQPSQADQAPCPRSRGPE